MTQQEWLEQWHGTKLAPAEPPPAKQAIDRMVEQAEARAALAAEASAKASAANAGGFSMQHPFMSRPMTKTP